MAEPIVLESVHHISRVVLNVAATADFYCNVLGFRKVWRPGFDFDGAWLYNDRFQFHLIRGQPPVRSPNISSRDDHLSFHVTDPDAAELRLQELAVRYVRRQQTGTGLTQLFFHDPDGNTIELGHYPPTRDA